MEPQLGLYVRHGEILGLGSLTSGIKSQVSRGLRRLSAISRFRVVRGCDAALETLLSNMKSGEKTALMVQQGCDAALETIPCIYAWETGFYGKLPRKQ
ncbi:hypothetical protein Tco_1536535, partial [Tanacetum coccineum]